MDLSIAIVNFNTGHTIRSCLQSVFEHTRDLSFEVFVVDNASDDGSPDLIRKDFPQVNLIINPENLYFTKASNQALKKGKGRYSLILNPDTFIRDNSFKKLVEFMDTHPNAGACGPRFLNPDGTLQGIGHRFPTLTYALLEFSLINAMFPDNGVRNRRVYKDRESLEGNQEIDAMGGSCMMVRKEAADQVGVLDEDFLMYAEETDWCYRIKQAGWKNYHVAGARVYHYGAESTKRVSQGKIEGIFRRSLLHYYKKHCGFLVYGILWILSSVSFRILSLYRWIRNS